MPPKEVPKVIPTATARVEAVQPVQKPEIPPVAASVVPKLPEVAKPKPVEDEYDRLQHLHNIGMNTDAEEEAWQEMRRMVLPYS